MDHSINLRDADMDAAIATLIRRLHANAKDTELVQAVARIERRLDAIERKMNMIAQTDALTEKVKYVTCKRGEDGAYTETIVVDRPKQESNQFG